MQKHLEAIVSLNAELWAISPDKPEALRSFGEKAGFGFPLLVDAESKTIKTYGVLNQEQGEIPHPTVAIIDTKGLVRFFHMDPNYRQRPDPWLILEVLRHLNSEKSRPVHWCS